MHNSRMFGGCEAYRMKLPADQLRTNRNVVVDYVHAEEFNDFIRQGREQLAFAYDIYVLPRAAFQDERAFQALRRMGKKIVIEVDDDFTGEHRMVFEEPMFSNFWRTCGMVDAFIVSTPYLGEVMRRKTGKPYFVCRNAVPVARWQGVSKQTTLTIGLTGSSTHKEDWRVLAGVMPKIIEMHPQVRWLIAGFMPDYLSSYQRYLPDLIDYRPWVSFADYPDIAGSAHIVLCPVDPTDRFNWSKSGIKAIEGMAAGAAVIATDLNIYREVLVSEQHGLLVPHTPDAWIQALNRVIVDDALRLRLGRRGQKHVERNFNIATASAHWWDAFERIMRLP